MLIRVMAQLRTELEAEAEVLQLQVLEVVLSAEQEMRACSGLLLQNQEQLTIKHERTGRGQRTNPCVRGSRTKSYTKDLVQAMHEWPRPRPAC